MIYVGNQLKKRLSAFSQRKAIIVYDAKLKNEAFELSKVFDKPVMSPHRVSETIKTLPTIEKIYAKMIQGGLDREGLLIALGGGVITDLAGFAASTYLRGIEWLSIPTTLVGQIDAAIGGKTGVNHPLGKNLIGTFYQPSQVLCDPKFLKTLPIRDRISGLGEMIKYGLIYDSALYSSLEKDWEKYVNLESPLLDRAVEQCVKLKMDAVSKDEKDQMGIRQVLNFGHTFAHAIEAATEYKVYRHGEAVIQGMRIALYLSVIQGCLDEQVQKRVDAFLSTIPMPKAPKIEPEIFLSYMNRDKKKKGGRIGFVLLSKIGEAFIDDTVSREAQIQAFKLL